MSNNALHTEPDDVRYTDLTVEYELDGSTNPIPEYIAERTVNLLSYHPMTNQRIILDTACWWFSNAGNCAIYRWIVNHLDSLENDVTPQGETFGEALREARNIGLNVDENGGPDDG